MELAHTQVLVMEPLTGWKRLVLSPLRVIAGIQHFHLILKYRSEKQALLDFRRVGHWYLKHLEGTKALRMLLNKIASSHDALSFVEKFPWEEL